MVKKSNAPLEKEQGLEAYGKKNAAKKAPAKKAGAMSAAALADDTGEEQKGGWGLSDAEQANSAANQAKEGDRAKVNGVDVVYRVALGKWVPAPPIKDDGTPNVGDKAVVNGVASTWDGQDWAPDKPTGQVGWGLDGQQKMVDENGDDASEGGKVKAAAAKKTASEKKAKAKADAADKAGVNLTGMAKDLVDGVERIERMAEERAAIGDDIKEVFAELKGKGYSTSTLRKVLARRQLDPDKRKEQDDMLALYEEALGK